MSVRWCSRIVAAGLMLLTGVSVPEAQTAKSADNYDELYTRYLDEARSATPASPDVQAWAWMSGLTLDRRANSRNDLITIRVVESITGSGTADASLSKASAAGIGVSSLFGVEKKLPSSVDPANLAAPKAKT